MKLKEKDLEDFLCEHHSLLVGDDYTDAIIIARQVVLTHGRLDILAFRFRGQEHGWTSPQVLVIELKVVPLKNEDIAQVGRYAYDISRVLESYAEELDLTLFNATTNGYHVDPRTKLAVKLAIERCCYSSPIGTSADGLAETGIMPMLIGKGRPDDNFLASSFGCGIETYGWFLDDNKLSVERMEPPRPQHNKTKWKNSLIQHIGGWAYDEASFCMVQGLFSNSDIGGPVWISEEGDQ